MPPGTLPSMFGQAGPTGPTLHQTRRFQRRRKARKKKRKSPSEQLLPAIVVGWRRRVNEAEIKRKTSGTKKLGHDTCTNRQPTVAKELWRRWCTGHINRPNSENALRCQPHQASAPSMTRCAQSQSNSVSNETTQRTDKDVKEDFDSQFKYFGNDRR